MANRRRHDWDAIEPDIRAGILSLSEIGRKHGCPHNTISDYIKRNGIKRDLTPKIRTRTKEKLSRTLPTQADKPTTDNVTDEEIIETQSDALASILSLQRNDISTLRELETKLVRELLNNPTKLYITQYQGKIVQKEVGLTASERALAANNLANTMHKRVALERQAYNLDETERVSVDDVLSVAEKINPAIAKALREALTHA